VTRRPLRVLVAGLGNVLLGDDGFGVEVLRRLSRRPPIARVLLAEFGTRGLDLVHAMLEGYDLAILVDATARGGRPGTVYTLVPDLSDARGPAGRAALASKGVALAAAVGAAPGRLFVVGCEPTPGADDPAPGLSAPVARAVEPAAALVEELVRSWMVRNVPGEALQAGGIGGRP
jgi:hydrogenase maturation protease